MKTRRGVSEKGLQIGFILLLLTTALSAQYNSGNKATQNDFKWPNGKKAAISLTFDDARYSQADIGIPLFDEYGVKATFYVTPHQMKDRLNVWKKAVKNGHEIANHTLSHPCSGNFSWSREKALENKTLGSMAKDIDAASDSIEQMVGMRPKTFAYPCGQTYVGRNGRVQSYIPLVDDRFIAGRTWMDEAPNDPSFCDLSHVYGVKSDDHDFEEIKSYINRAVKEGGWLVLAGHEIDSEPGGLTTRTDMLEQLLTYATDPVNGLWIAPVNEVATYISKTREESALNATPVYKDASRTIDERVEDLLSRMTLEEKIGQMNMPCMYVHQMGETIEEKKEAAKKFVTGNKETGVGPGGGFFTFANSVLHVDPDEQATFFNKLQEIALNETRLGIPLLQTEEGTHGLMCAGGTIYPEGPGIGSTWNLPLIEQIYAATAREARTTGIHQLYTLVVEPNRDPRLGRNIETYSEDPFMCAEIATSIVKAVQGTDVAAEDKAVAGLCHYPGQSQALGGLERCAMNISERELREIFLPPWEAGIKKSGALGVMATYPAIDGVPVHASEKILTDMLRGELGFEGLVLSEGEGFATILWEKVAASQKDAGILALNAGVDVGITYEEAYMMPMIENIKEDKVHVELIDRAVRRILRLKFQLGLFENPFVDPAKAKKVRNSEEHQELALQCAREGIVLLKNEDNLLPLDKNKLKSIAVIGPNANNERNQLGDYVSKIITQDIVTVLEGIKASVSPDTKVNYVKGCNVLTTDFNEIDKAKRVARKSDVAIVVVGENERWAKDAHGNEVATSGEHKDVASLDLTDLQQKLIKEVHATGTPVIVVMINGRPISTRWTSEHVPAIVEAWLPGEKGGHAIAEVIFGDYNPSGRLTVSVPRHAGQLPMYYNYFPSKQRRAHSGYVDMSVTPLYEFGFGLSYTTFEYSNLKLSSEKIGVAGDIRITADVRNTGERAGQEVVQLYINDVISSMVTPIRELKGFEKVSLEPGETETVSFTLNPEDLSFINSNMEKEVEPGIFKVMVGRSCEDIKLKDEFEVIAKK
jgi:beta-glucosidase